MKTLKLLLILSLVITLNGCKSIHGSGGTVSLCRQIKPACYYDPEINLTQLQADINLNGGLITEDIILKNIYGDVMSPETTEYLNEINLILENLCMVEVNCQ